MQPYAHALVRQDQCMMGPTFRPAEVQHGIAKCRVHFFSKIKRSLYSILKKQNAAPEKLDPKKAVFRAEKRKNAKKRTRHFRTEKCACAQ